MENYSILMTIYVKDNPNFIKESIDSLLNQTHKSNDFVIVCDGELTKEQEDIIADYSSSNDFFNIIRLSENVGLGSALKIGLTYCVNELVARLDDDDIAYPNRCETQVTFLTENPQISLVGSPVIEFEISTDNHLRVKKVPEKHKDIIKYLRRRNAFNHSSVMFRKSHIVEAGNYSNMRTNQDVELWVRLLNKGYYGHNLSEPLVFFRFDKDTYIRRKKWNNIRSLISVWRNFYKSRYCSIYDFLFVVFIQLVIFIMPIRLLEWSYNNLR